MLQMIFKEYKGILFSLIIGSIAYFASTFLPQAFNSIILALILGIFIGNVFKIPVSFSAGIGIAGSKLLELSILLLAFSVNYSHLSELGTKSFSIIGIMVIIMLLLSYFLAIKIKCPGSTGWLIGFGTTICGSAAIAALAPTVSKNKEDVAIAMAVVNLFGSIGMIAMPYVLNHLSLSTIHSGLLLGGGLHSVGNVAGAAYSMSNEIGETAITIKLARVALLSPALIFFNFLVNRKNARNIKSLFTLPWYLWGFIIITVFGSFITFPIPFLDSMEMLGKITLTIVMAAIGLKVSFKGLYTSGRKGVLFGTIIFFIQIALLELLVFIL